MIPCQQGLSLPEGMDGGGGSAVAASAIPFPKQVIRRGPEARGEEQKMHPTLGRRAGAGRLCLATPGPPAQLCSALTYLGSGSAPRRRISWDADACLSGAYGASSRRRVWWRRCPAGAAAKRGRTGCCTVAAAPRTRRRSSWLDSARRFWLEG